MTCYGLTSVTTSVKSSISTILSIGGKFYIELLRPYVAVRFQALCTRRFEPLQAASCDCRITFGVLRIGYPPGLANATMILAIYVIG
ncbi:hypothetical protein K474DRAFT_1662703 [Panus rudis PR-1116 ss-1]|nr:hypothetical protein K474DRAFT_1662703 [Panus rudis PR-1116 ss-1]